VNFIGIEISDYSSIFSIQYYKDTQINWFAYTSLFNGNAAAQVSTTSKVSRPKPSNWQDALAINAYWGFIHAQSYIAFVNECLGLDIPCDITALGQLQLNFEDGREKVLTSGYMHWTQEPMDSTRLVKVPASENKPFLFMANMYDIWGLEDDDEGRKRATELHSLYLQWDRCVSKMIHDTVYGTDRGRRALRTFHGLETE